MSKDEAQLELELHNSGKNAPRLTPDYIDDVIVEEMYWNPTGTTLTVCVLVLQNGFTVTGTSASASFANFDPEIGRAISRENARRKIWELEGYLLRQQLWIEEKTRPTDV